MSIGVGKEGWGSVTPRIKGRFIQTRVLKYQYFADIYAFNVFWRSQRFIPTKFHLLKIILAKVNFGSWRSQKFIPVKFRTRKSLYQIYLERLLDMVSLLYMKGVDTLPCFCHDFFTFNLRDQSVFIWFQMTRTIFEYFLKPYTSGKHIPSAVSTAYISTAILRFGEKSNTTQTPPSARYHYTFYFPYVNFEIKEFSSRFRSISSKFYLIWPSSWSRLVIIWLVVLIICRKHDSKFWPIYHKGRVKIYRVPGPGPLTGGERFFRGKKGCEDFFSGKNRGA